MDIRQATKELVNPVSWVRIVLAVVILFGVYKWLTRSTQYVKVGQGGTANIYNSPKRFLIPFIEAGVEQRKDSDLGTYIRGGVRFEF
jgi:hypothetical protein